MNALIVVALVLVAACATVVVASHSPDQQAVSLSLYGLLLSLLFVLLGSPDVGLSQLAVGAAIVPLMVMLTIRKIRRGRS